MSDTKPVEVNPEQLQSIGGGGCTAQDLISMSNQLTSAYESLVDFTSHVISRVSGSF